MLRSMFCVHFGWIWVQGLIGSILFSFGWIWVQVLIDASVDFVFFFRLDLASELVSFWLHSGSSLEPFWFHFGSIFVPFGVHFGTIWLLTRGPVEEKFPSRSEGRGEKVALLHFKRCWAQKGATRLLKIDQKSMKNRCKNQWEIRLGFGRALGAFLVDFVMFLGPWTLDFECLV